VTSVPNATNQTRTHRIQLDLKKHAHKIEMDLHRKHITEERLTLAKRSQEFRESQAAARAAEKVANKDSQPSTSAALNQPFRLWTAEEIATNQPKIEAAIQADPFLRYIGLPATPIRHQPSVAVDVRRLTKM